MCLLMEDRLEIGGVLARSKLRLIWAEEKADKRKIWGVEELRIDYEVCT